MMKQEARKPGSQESGDRRTDDPFWISGFLLPSKGWIVTGLIFSTVQFLSSSLRDSGTLPRPIAGGISENKSGAFC